MREILLIKQLSIKRIPLVLVLFFQAFELLSQTPAKHNNQLILHNTHQIGLNMLAFTRLTPKTPFGEDIYQKALISYRFLNKSNFNPYLHVGAKASTRQSQVDPENGTLDENKISNFHIQFGLDHRFYISSKLGIYAGIGFLFQKREDKLVTQFNSGNSVQETISNRISQRDGLGFSATFEYALNSRWKVASRLEYRKMLVTEKETFHNSFYPNLSKETSSNRIYESILWPCQFIIQYNLTTI